MSDLLKGIIGAIDFDTLQPSLKTESFGGGYDDIISRAAEQYGLTDKIPIIKNMLQAESGGNRLATSPKGARGLMQLMPGTARAMGVKNINDPEQNIFGGVRYLKEMYDLFVDDALAVAAYNAGPGKVKHFQGIPPYKETQNYVKKVLSPVQTQQQVKSEVAGVPGVFQDTINTIEREGIFYGSGKQKKVFGDEWKEDCCGGFTTTMVNRGLRAQGVPDSELLPTSNLGTQQPKYLADKFGSQLVTSKDRFTPETIRQMGEGTVIAGHKSDGGTHAEMVVRHPQTGELVVASYGIKGKTVQYKPITPGYTQKLNMGRFSATNPFSAINPQTNMVAGPGAPPAMQPSAPAAVTEKNLKISEIMGDLAKRLGPSEAEAAPPPSQPQSELIKSLMQDDLNKNQSNPSSEIIKDLMKEGPANLPGLPSTGEQKGIFYPGKVAPVGQTGVMAKMPIAPQTEPPSFMTLGKAAMVDDMAAKFKLLASARFPNNPEKWKDYFTDDNGDIWYQEKGVIKREVSKDIMDQAKNFAAQEVIGRGPENVGAGLGFAAGGVPGAIAGAGAGSIVRQQFAKDFLGDKPKSITDEALIIGKEMIFAGLGGAFGKGLETGLNAVTRLKTRTGLMGKLEQQYSQPGSITPGQIEKWTDLYGRYGVDITAAEATNSPTIQGLFQMLSVVPGTAKEKAGLFMAMKRVPQINNAIRQELGSIAPEISLGEAGQMAQEASAGVKAKLIADRKSATSRLYNDAINNAGPVDAQPVIDKIDEFISKVSPGGVERKQLEAMKGLFYEGDNLITDAAQIKSARDNLNKIINGKYDPALPSTVNTINREATIIKNRLSGQMYKASPDFKLADVEFARMSKPLNEYLYGTPNKPLSGKPNTLIQKIGKIESSEDLEKVPAKVFGATPKAISNMREWFLANGYDNEWNGLVRGMLQDRLDKVKLNVVNEDMGLKGSSFFKKAFEDHDFQLKFKSAMSPEQFRSLKDFFELMKQTGKIVYTNSQTTPMRELIDALKNTPIGIKDVPSTLGKLYANVFESITSPSKVIGRYEANRMIDKGDVLFDAMFDPRLTARMSHIRKMPNDVTKAAKFLTTYLGMVALHNRQNEKNVKAQNESE